MSEDNNNGRAGGLLIAFTIGAAIGAGVALLYAPRSGKETRKLLARKGKELKDQATETIEDAKEFIAEKKASLLGAVDAGKEALSAATKHK